jgi:hypothetical protein
VAAAPLPGFVTYANVQHPVLPQGIHDADLVTIEADLVNAFAPNAQRRVVFDGWVAFRNLLRTIVGVKAEYIDGSFVTEKPAPKDIDVSFWIDADDLLQLTPTQQTALNDLLARASSFHVDGYIVPECGPGHPSQQAHTWESPR